MDTYDRFVEELSTKYPEMYKDVYCGISIHEGWFEIVRCLSDRIYSHYKHQIQTRERLLKDNPYDHPIPEATEFPKVAQIKEKFGGLRFYVDGGDEYTYGAIAIAESWADRTCETCGAPGTRRSGGWVRTLCDTHEAEHQKRKQELE